MKKEKTLSEKTHQFEDLEEWVYLKDVKQFIKEILDEIPGLNYWEIEEIIKQKSGFEELE